MSRAWEIDRRIVYLIGRMAREEITPEEAVELQSLQRERVELMMPETRRQPRKMLDLIP